MRSRDKLDVYARRMEGYGGKWWMFVRQRSEEPEWVPSFEDWFRMIRALCFCELMKYEGRVQDPLDLPRRFFNRCFDADLRALTHDEAWDQLKREFGFKR